MSHVETAELLPDVPAKLRRRRRFWIALALLLFILWLVSIAGLFIYWTERDLREAMAEADRDSPVGWRIDELEAQREQIPDEENAALVAFRVKTLLPAAWPMDVKVPKTEEELQAEGAPIRLGSQLDCCDLLAHVKGSEQARHIRVILLAAGGLCGARARP